MFKKIIHFFKSYFSSFVLVPVSTPEPEQEVLALPGPGPEPEPEPGSIEFVFRKYLRKKPRQSVLLRRVVSRNIDVIADMYRQGVSAMAIARVLKAVRPELSQETRTVGTHILQALKQKSIEKNDFREKWTEEDIIRAFANESHTAATERIWWKK